MRSASSTTPSFWYRRRLRIAERDRARLLRCLLGITIAVATASPARAMAALATPRYTATVLSTLCTDFGSTPCPTYPLSNGAGISDTGWIVGDSNYPGTWLDPSTPSIALPLTEHATLWRDGRITDLGTLGGPNSSTGFVTRPNDAGVIAGNAQTATVDPFTEQWALNFGCTPNNDPCDGSQYEVRGFVWRNGVMRELPTLGGSNAFAWVVNAQGQMSGVAEDALVDGSCQSNSPTGGPTQHLDWEPVVYGPGNGQIRELPLYPGDHVGAASAINDLGEAVGGSGFCGPIAPPNLTHALFWQRGSVINLGSLGGTYDNAGTAINDRGQVAGWSDLPGDTFDAKTGMFSGITHAFLWQHGTMTDLGTLPRDINSFAYGMNNAGQVVGQSCGASGCRAVLWAHGTIYDLNRITRVNTDRPLVLVNAAGINDSGAITGLVLDQSTTDDSAFSALPCSPAPVAAGPCSGAAPTAARSVLTLALSHQGHVLDRARYGPGFIGQH